MVEQLLSSPQERGLPLTSALTTFLSFLVLLPSYPQELPELGGTQRRCPAQGRAEAGHRVNWLVSEVGPGSHLLSPGPMGPGSMLLWLEGFGSMSCVVVSALPAHARFPTTPHSPLSSSPFLSQTLSRFSGSGHLRPFHSLFLLPASFPDDEIDPGWCS